MKKRAMLIANSASMIDHFNKDNISILQSMGYEITVAANFRDGNSSTGERIRTFSRELADQGIEIIDLPIPRKVTQLSKTFSSISILKKYLASHPCDIVHTQTPFGGVVGRLAAKKARAAGMTKVIYFVHGFHFFRGASWKNYLIYYNIEKYLSRITDCLITLNREDYEAASQRFHHPNVRYVPGIGVDADAIYHQQVDVSVLKDALGIPADSKVILTVAELIPRKNIEETIRVFAEVEDQNSVLLICGKGQLLGELKNLCQELGIRDRVIFAGYRTDILDIYHIADIFLFTSFQEGLPVGLMQAMAAGLPAVASDIRGNRDLLGADEHTDSAAYLTDINAPEEFVRKLDELLADPARRRTLGEANARRIREHFDISAVHSLMSEIYRSLEVQS